MDDEAKGISVWEGSASAAASAAAAADGGVYGDPETRAFYEDLPDLLNLVPLVSLGLTPDQASLIGDAHDVIKYNYTRTSHLICIDLTDCCGARRTHCGRSGRPRARLKARGRRWRI